VSRSPATLGWAADVIEIVVDNQCPDPDRRVGFVSQVLTKAGESLGRGSAGTVALLHQLASEMDLQQLVPLPSTDFAQEALRDVSGLVIGLYSLTESALKRAEAYLTSAWPGLKVVARADHVGSAELESLARNADFFVVAVRSGKHAATEFIKAKRGALPTRNATGKGSSSLIGEVENWLRAA
jgi:hypothetical protein